MYIFFFQTGETQRTLSAVDLDGEVADLVEVGQGVLPVEARPPCPHARLLEAAQVEDGLDAGQAGDGDQEVQLPRAVFQVDPEVVSAVPVQTGEVNRAPENE